MGGGRLRKRFDPQTLERVGFPTISYDGLRVGEEFRSDERQLRPQEIEAYAFAVDDYDPWFLEESPFGGPVAQPTLLANQALFLRSSRYVVPAGLHARMAFAFLRPICLGAWVRTTGRVVDKYIRRGKPYMVTEYRTADGHGDTLIEGRFVQMLLEKKAPRAGSSSPPETRPPASDPSILRAAGRAGPLELHQPIGPVIRTVTQRQIDVYSGVRPGSIHTDSDWAREKGLDTTIAQGMMSTAYVSTLMTTGVGEGFVAGGRMDVRFLRRVHPGDTLTVTGVVTGFSREGDRVRVQADVSAHNQDGDQTLAGTASGLARAPAHAEQ